MKKTSNHSDLNIGSARDVVADVIFALPDRDLATLARQASDEVLAGAVRLMGDVTKRELLMSAAAAPGAMGMHGPPPVVPAPAPKKQKPKKRAGRLTPGEVEELHTSIVALLDMNEGRTWTAEALAKHIGETWPRLGAAALSTYRNILRALVAAHPSVYRTQGKRGAKFWRVQGQLAFDDDGANGVDAVAADELRATAGAG